MYRCRRMFFLLGMLLLCVTLYAESGRTGRPERDVGAMVYGEATDSDCVIESEETLRNRIVTAMVRAEPFVTLQLRKDFACDLDYENVLREIERTEVLARSYLSHHAWRAWEAEDTEEACVTLCFWYTEPERIAILEKKKRAEEAARLLAGEIFTSEMTEWERLLLAHDVLRARCDYASDAASADAHTAYGGLCAGLAVCEGYAEAFALLLKQGGIPCLVVTGSTKEGMSHAWNLVAVKGIWYHVDVTWDDSSFDHSDAYAYFLKGDDVFSESRIWEREEYPSANGSAVSAEEIRAGLSRHGVYYRGFQQASGLLQVERACMGEVLSIPPSMVTNEKILKE